MVNGPVSNYFFSRWLALGGRQAVDVGGEILEMFSNHQILHGFLMSVVSAFIDLHVGP